MLLIFLLLINCSKDNSTVSDTSEEIVSNLNDSESEISNSESESLTTNIGEGVPSVFSKIYGASDIYIEDSNIVIKVDGPDWTAGDFMFFDNIIGPELYSSPAYTFIPTSMSNDISVGTNLEIETEQ